MIKQFIFILLTTWYLASANGQVNVSRPVPGVNTTTNASTYSFTAFSPTPSSLLVVFVVAPGSVIAAPTITNTGTTLTWVREASRIVAGTGYHIFWARVPTAVSVSTITYNCTGDAADGINMSIHSFTNGPNRYMASPIVQAIISTTTTTSTNATISFNRPLRPLSGYVIGWSGLLNGATNNSTEPAGFTESDDFGFSTPSRNFSTARRNGGLATAGPFTFTNANTTWVALGVEVGFINSGIPLSILFQ